MYPALEQEIRELIQKDGRITFARFMQTCLYSPRGGFYSARRERIGAHFGTAPTSHPVFGKLIARQLEQMWRLLGEPPVFHLIEVGAGDGALARSIAQATPELSSAFTQALYYVAADYESRWPADASHAASEDKRTYFQRVRTAGLGAFRNVTGCILSNELIDNFPVQRFVIGDGKVREVFVTLDGGNFAEVLGEPSTPRMAEWLESLNLSLPNGYRGEINLAMENWTSEVSRALDRGFVLTVDYGQLASELYAPGKRDDTLVCFHQHAVQQDYYQNIGQQDITCHVDFTSLMRLGEQHGLAPVGYTPQRDFLMNLGFSGYLDALESQDLSAARKALSRMAMMSLVDPEQYGDLKVLAQAKGITLKAALAGFTR